jgi:hypothetical protein
MKRAGIAIDSNSPEVPRGSRGGADRPRVHEPVDARKALSQQVHIPRTETRERVDLRQRSYRLRDSEVEVPAAVGAFRIVDARDLDAGSSDGRRGDLAHLREQKLVEVVGPHFRDGERATAVVLTKEGRELLEAHQRTGGRPSQTFHSGLAKPREALHDAQLYKAYTEAAKRLQDGGARIRRVVLDYELKREYQRYLQANNRGKRHSTGKPDRDVYEIAVWARQHDLPARDGHVQFPDVRIEYDRPDGREGHLDIELTTEHYSSRQMAGKAASGFSMARGSSSRGRGGSPFDPKSAQKALR